MFTILEEDDTFISADVYITPPDQGDATDEDSGPEDNDGEIDNLSGAQLRCQAEAVIQHCDGDMHLGADVDAVESTQYAAEVEDMPGSAPAPKSRKKIATERKWSKKDLTSDPSVWNSQETPAFLQKDMTPAHIFDLFFDYEVLEFIVAMTNLYAFQKGKPTFSVSSEEIRGVLAILLLSGYVTVPSRRLFWENSNDVHNSAVTSVMSVNRFEEILRYLHFADNQTLKATDKMAKIRPFYNMMNERFLRFWPPEQDIDVDESMVPYFGKHSAKQFIKGKPIRFGFKVWCLNTRHGYLIQCEPYQGGGTQIDPQFGLGGSVVLDLLSELPPRNHHLYIDNYFTSLKLLHKLKNDGIACTGTIRANRVEKAPLKAVDKMKKEQRGSYDFCTDQKSGIIVVRWNDNSVVNVASNSVGVNPITQVKRWSAAKKQKIMIDQPHLINKYNHGMGGTDRMDQNISQYRIGIRCKKWWWSLFAFVPDVVVQNAWQIYRKTPSMQHEPLTLLEFRRSIVRTYIMKHGSRPNPGRPVGRTQRLNVRVPNDARFDGLHHYIEPIQTQRRCAQCGKKAKTVCCKCDVAVHDKCFKLFHLP